MAHYDYWENRLRPSIILDAKADMIVYGMGERTVADLARRLDAGEQIADITDMPQTLFISKGNLPGRETSCSIHTKMPRRQKLQALNFRHVEEESNKYAGAVIWQEARGKMVKINPMLPPMSTGEIDASFDLPTPGCLIHATEGNRFRHTK